MKKTYIAPEMNVMVLETESLMLTVSAPGEDGLGGSSWGGVATDKEAEANKKRRGSWGNLWN